VGAADVSRMPDARHGFNITLGVSAVIPRRGDNWHPFTYFVSDSAANRYRSEPVGDAIADLGSSLSRNGSGNNCES